jgi:Flp pilus assembly pilin Flp
MKTAVGSTSGFLRDFLRDDGGQDLVEYTILMTFVALASIAVMNGAGHVMKGIWTSANSELVLANTSAS